ncbi:MAG TPA: endolytic transglycosylase MltG [Rhizomicrobium sp.]|jgi:UPF0755 protein|nr:endolytic transglycosylase MltG [Rhizomicrobium sp.]
MRRFLLLFFLLIIVAGAAFFAEQWEFFASGPPARHGNATIIWIKSGERSAAIAGDLQNAGIVKNAALFRFGVWLRGKNTALKAGEFAIPSRTTMADVMGIFVSGKAIEHRITAAEGLTSAMIYEMVRKNPVLVGDAGVVPAEGSLLPETYLFILGTTRAELLERMARAQQRFLTKQWPKRTANLPFASQQDAVTLASIVEKETAIPEERRHIAAVFINRLKAGMKLQSDPTTIYGLTRGYPLGRGIRESELQATTPYNTYVIAGLPPTPICNPGKASLEAVLQPEDSADLYFVANGSGGHVFTSSIQEHEKNVVHWRQIEQQKGALLSVPAQTTAVPPEPPVAAPATGTTPRQHLGQRYHARRH